MRRIHVGLTVEDLQASVQFYSTLFGVEPGLQRPDYAKWMLEDPRVNFSITTRCAPEGKVHFGIQVEQEAELAEIGERLEAAGEAVSHQPETTCCYHHSSKTWARDPEGFHWETFLTTAVAAEFGENGVGSFSVPGGDPRPAEPQAVSACCGSTGC